MRTPPTRSGEVWLLKHVEAYGRWAAAGGRDAAALAKSVDAVRTLLERCPDYAPEVELLAAITCHVGRRSGLVDLIVRMSAVGAEAGLLADDADRVPGAGEVMLLGRAEAELHADRRVAGLMTLARIDRGARARRGGDPMSAWIRARTRFLQGGLHELALEDALAHAAFGEALDHARPLVADDASRAAFAAAWSAVLRDPLARSGPGAADGSVEASLAVLEAHALLAASAIGFARTAAAGAAPAQRGAAARTAVEAIAQIGPPADLSPYDFVPIVAMLPPEEAMQQAEALVAAVERNRRAVAEGEVPAGLTAPRAVEVVRAGLRRQSEHLAAFAPLFPVAARIGVAYARHAAGDLDAAERVAMQAVRDAMAARAASIQLVAMGALLEIAAARDAADAVRFLEMFDVLLGGTLAADPAWLAEPRSRALLDRSIESAIRLLLTQGPDWEDPRARVRVSALIDLLRSAVLPPPQAILPARSGDEAVDPEVFAADSLGRLRRAMTERPDAVAVVLQGLGDELAIITVLGGDGAVGVERAPAAALDALRALEEAAGAALRAPARDRLRADAALEQAGRAAFEALPASVRQAIDAHDTLLLAPDSRSRLDTVPYELLRGDGHGGWLGVTRVIARFTSLAQLAAALDTRAAVPRMQRALVVAAPVAEGYDPLDLAAFEQEEIGATLARAGFDAPPIDPPRLAASFFTDRLSYVDVLHVSAHGEAGAGTEWLVLPGGRRLVVNDLEASPQRSYPFVYLNTCNLGQTRYLGAGLSRGLAHAFAELGAPAVVAHATPVPDRAAVELAIAFYDEAGAGPVGEALRCARRAVAESGTRAAVWATAILLGDPDHRLVPGDAPLRDDAAADLLDGIFAPDRTEASADEAWRAAVAVARQGEHPRLDAAFGVIELMSACRDPDEPADAAALDRAIALADRLRHPGTRALLHFVRANHRAGRETGEGLVALLTDTIRHINAAAGDGNAAWNGYLQAAREHLAAQESALRGVTMRVRMPEGRQDDGSMAALMQAIMGAQQAAADTYGRATLRDEEASVEDVAWNAVVAGHPNRISDMIETTRYAEIVVRKLVHRAELHAAAVPFAVPMMAGLLRHLWDRQNASYLAPDFAAGQTGAVLAMLEDLRARWSPPDAQPWFPLVADVPDRVDATVADVRAQPWATYRDYLPTAMDALRADLLPRVEAVAAQHPEALAGCTAFVCGVIVQRNTFSAVECSEDDEKALKDLYWALDRDNESRYAAYLEPGFGTVANRPPDELERWRLGVAPADSPAGA